MDRRSIETGIAKGLKVLDAYGFSECLDESGDFNKNRRLWYKGSYKNKFIVFSEHKNGHKVIGFDMWICQYYPGAEIGKEKPKEKRKVKFSFDFETEMEILKKYIPKKEPLTNRQLDAFSFNKLIKHKNEE